MKKSVLQAVREEGLLQTSWLLAIAQDRMGRHGGGGHPEILSDGGGCQGEGTRGQSQSHTLTHQRSALSVFKELQCSFQPFHFASLSSRLTVSGGTQRIKEGQEGPAWGL